jgi:hypothetical protein
VSPPLRALALYQDLDQTPDAVTATTKAAAANTAHLAPLLKSDSYPPGD